LRKENLVHELRQCHLLGMRFKAGLIGSTDPAWKLKVTELRGDVLEFPIGYRYSFFIRSATSSGGRFAHSWLRSKFSAQIPT